MARQARAGTCTRLAARALGAPETKPERKKMAGLETWPRRFPET